MAKLNIVRSRGSYEDGGENYVLSSMKKSQDVSAFSEELEGKIIDWPSDYHFSSERLNLLSFIDIEPGISVLDIGGGTGIISRFLAEKGCKVTLLEGEIKRAQAAAERLREFEDAEIIVGELFAIPDGKQFDLIVICGVLEYIGNLSSNEWLRKVAQFLKPDGSIVLAIENKFGLKYWLGYPEDHTGKVMDSLMDFQGKDSPRTYTSLELADKLLGAGMKSINFMYPFPDYKKPLQIITENGLLKLTKSEIINLISHPFANHAGASIFNCDEKLIFSTVVQAGQLKSMANSFIVIASKEVLEKKIYDERILLIRCDSSSRKKIYRRWRYLLENEKTGSFFWRSAEQGADSRKGPVTETPFEQGVNFLDYLRGTKENSQKAVIIREWLRTVKFQDSNYEKYGAGSNQFLSNIGYKNQFCPGHFKISKMDIGFSNYIINSEGKIKDLDEEWLGNKSVCLELAIMRSLYYAGSFSAEDFCVAFKKISFGEKILANTRSIIGHDNNHSLEDFISVEVAFLNSSHAINVKKARSNLKNELKSTKLESPGFSVYKTNRLSSISRILRKVLNKIK